MYKLHYFPGNASIAPHMLMEELGVDYELVYVDRNKQAHKSPEYLALNPSGRIPVLEDGAMVISETAAICLHLADRHPEGRMAPDIATPERAKFYQWLMFLTNTIQTEFLVYYYSERYSSDSSDAQAIKEAAEQRLIGYFEIVEAQLAKKGPYMMGKAVSFLDFYLLMLCRWGRFLSTKPSEMKHLGKHIKLISKHPAVLRTFEQEGLEAPFA
ncbi:glutathione S-transferase [Kiloniella litopenaei]|uniref:Glutathione S-transferase n=1 Tax=Kiloniella litopenaei TaxID=1549748 RepID=A0A0M2R5W2_9PROT|nr:glutathione S-transferase family protein [Kiloniella litopenaei]KKJ75834.1 glutathione S-transferase [Kiloniella litopenaei]